MEAGRYDIHVFPHIMTCSGGVQGFPSGRWGQTRDEDEERGDVPEESPVSEGPSLRSTLSEEIGRGGRGRGNTAVDRRGSLSCCTHNVLGFRALRDSCWLMMIVVFVVSFLVDACFRPLIDLGFDFISFLMRVFGVVVFILPLY